MAGGDDAAVLARLLQQRTEEAAAAVAAQREQAQAYRSAADALVRQIDDSVRPACTAAATRTGTASPSSRQPQVGPLLCVC